MNPAHESCMSTCICMCVCVCVCVCVRVPGVLMDALDGRAARGLPLHQSGVALGKDGLAGDSVGVDIQSRSAQPVAASLVRQRAAVACGPRESPHT